MQTEHLTGLMAAYGMEKTLERPSEFKTRYSGNGTFIDVWDGRRGIVIGVYDRRTKSVRYHRRPSMNQIEDILIRIEKETNV